MFGDCSTTNIECIIEVGGCEFVPVLHPKRCLESSVPGKHWCKVVEDEVEGKVGLADKGEDSQEHCHQGEKKEEDLADPGKPDQGGQAKTFPYFDHVQKDAGYIGRLKTESV